MHFCLDLREFSSAMLYFNGRFGSIKTSAIHLCQVTTCSDFLFITRKGEMRQKVVNFESTSLTSWRWAYFLVFSACTCPIFDLLLHWGFVLGCIVLPCFFGNIFHILQPPPPLQKKKERKKKTIYIYIILILKV